MKISVSYLLKLSKYIETPSFIDLQKITRDKFIL